MMQQYLIKNGFTLNTYPEGKYWEKQTGEFHCLQTTQEFDEFTISEDGWVWQVSEAQFKDYISIK